MPAVCRALVVLTVFVCSQGGLSRAATVATENFLVTASSEAVARRVAGTAEFQRKKLAMLWYGHELKNWAARCTIEVDTAPDKGAGGSTSFRFSGGEVYGWRMRVQGSVERILDSVIPHEVNHTILACYFRRKVPRWADEGAATIFEHVSERQRQIREVQQLMHNGRRIPLRVLMSMSQYPSDMRQVMAMYAQSYSVTDYLIQKRGRRTFLNFLNDAHRQGWDAALRTHYEQKSIEHLEQDWTGWVMAGFPRLNLPDGQLLAGAAGSEATTVRGQSPSMNEAVSPDRSPFRPLPGLNPAAKVATHLRASWRHTAAVVSRVRNAGGAARRPAISDTVPFAISRVSSADAAGATEAQGTEAQNAEARAAGAGDRSLQALELRQVPPRRPVPGGMPASGPPPVGRTPTETRSPVPPDGTELRALELIPLEAARSDARSYRQSSAIRERSVDRANPFADASFNGLSRLIPRQSVSAEGPSPVSGAPSGTVLRETRLHQRPDLRKPQTLSDWGRFPSRVH